MGSFKKKETCVFTMTTSPCRMLSAGTTTTCPCRTRSTPRPGGATTTTPAPCPRAHTGGWRGHVSPRVFTCRVQTALLPDPGQQRDLRADDPLGRPHGRLRRGRVRGRCARPVPGGCCRGPVEVSSQRNSAKVFVVHNICLNRWSSGQEGWLIMLSPCRQSWASTSQTRGSSTP